MAREPDREHPPPTEQQLGDTDHHHDLDDRSPQRQVRRGSEDRPDQPSQLDVHGLARSYHAAGIDQAAAGERHGENRQDDERSAQRDGEREPGNPAGPCQRDHTPIERHPQRGANPLSRLRAPIRGRRRNASDSR